MRKANQFLIIALVIVCLGVFFNTAFSQDGWYNTLQAPSDVDKSEPTDGQALVWDGTLGLWVPTDNDSDTLQSVTDKGNTTTNDIITTGVVRGMSFQLISALYQIYLDAPNMMFIDPTIIALGRALTLYEVAGTLDTVCDRNATTDKILTTGGLTTSGPGTFGDIFLPGLTEGSVTFIGASGVITQDNVNLSWDNTNKTLDLGTPGTDEGYIRKSNIVHSATHGLLAEFIGTISDFRSAIRINMDAASADTARAIQVFDMRTAHGIQAPLGVINKAATFLFGLSFDGNISPAQLVTNATTCDMAFSPNNIQRIFIDAGTGDIRFYNAGDTTNYSNFLTGANGALTISTVDSDGALGHIALMPDGNVGIGDLTPDYPVEILNSTGPQFAISHTDTVDFATFDVDSDGDLTITPSGGTVIVSGTLKTTSGRIVNTTRIDDGDSPYTILNSDHNIFCDTDGGAITANLLAGVNGTYYRITNTGSSGLNLTLTPDGAELLKGSNSSTIIADGSTIIIVYEASGPEGWW